MSLLLYGLVAVFVQLLLAFLTAQDAHQRGHDRDVWFIAVLIFGILAIIIYLLTRNDREVPYSERKSEKTASRLVHIVSYSGSAILGAAVLFVITVYLATFIFPDSPLIEQCGGFADMVYSSHPDPNNPCEITMERRSGL